MKPNRFPYKGRIIQNGLDSDGKSTLYGYEATEQEANRIKTKYGSSFVTISPINGKPLVYIGGYRNNDRNQIVDFPPAIDEDKWLGISNSELSLSIRYDPTFYPLATGQPSPNTGNPNQPGPDGGSTPVSEPNTPAPQETGILKYPLDMRGDQDRIMFHAHQYVSGNRIGGPFGSLNPVKYEGVPNRVYLPIQAPITDQNSVGWEPDTMNPLEIEAAKVSKELMKSKGIKDITAIATDAFKQAVDRSKAHEESIRTFLVGQAIGVNNLYSRLEGKVLNPNMELLFQGPQLRPFNFTFKLSAREPAEATRIKRIIRYFKRNMAVKRGEDVVFLQAPNVFKIQYQYGNGKPHKSLNLIKMCALTNCSVDYTPLGSYMTYDDKEHTMVAYTLSLSFQELTPIYNDDYKEFKYGEGESIKVPSENSIGP